MSHPSRWSLHLIARVGSDLSAVLLAGVVFAESVRLQVEVDYEGSLQKAITQGRGHRGVTDNLGPGSHDLDCDQDDTGRRAAQRREVEQGHSPSLRDAATCALSAGWCPLHRLTSFWA